MDFSKGNFYLILTRSFTETELVGILEAADVDCVDHVSPFLGALSDKFCEKHKTAEVSKVLT